jgi:hypothetical protein
MLAWRRLVESSRREGPRDAMAHNYWLVAGSSAGFGLHNCLSQTSGYGYQAGHSGESDGA